jgi:hypothetical protein
MDSDRVRSLKLQLEQKVSLANEQIRKAQEEYAREMEIERNKDIESSTI